MNKHETIETFTLDPCYTFPLVTQLHKFPNYSITEVNGSWSIIGELDEGYSVPINTGFKLHIEIYKFLASKRGYNSEESTFYDIKLLEKCLKAGCECYSDDEEKIFKSIRALILQYGIPAPSLTFVGSHQYLTQELGTIISRLKSLYYTFAAWLHEAYEDNDLLKEITSKSVMEILSIPGVLYGYLPNEIVNIKLQSLDRVQIIHEVVEGWLDVASIQLKYLITGNAEKVLICKDCRMPYNRVDGSAKYCGKCRTDAARKRRSRRKLRVKNGKETGAQ